MAKTFDFNALEQPILETVLLDDNHTKVRLTVPTEGVFERFVAMSKDVEALAKTKDPLVLRRAYELWAEVFNCNADGLTFTAESLKDVYNIKLVHLLLFQPAYLEFIQDIQNAKN